MLLKSFKKRNDSQAILFANVFHKIKVMTLVGMLGALRINEVAISLLGLTRFDGSRPAKSLYQE